MSGVHAKNTTGLQKTPAPVTDLLTDAWNTSAPEIPPTPAVDPAADRDVLADARSLADVVTLQRRRQARISAYDEESFFLDTLSEYQWARDAARLAQETLDGLIKPVIEVCEFYGTVPWQLTSREVDRYFAFLEQRYARARS